VVFRIVIPARYGSSRFPGKPLALLAGKPMLQWVYERAAASGAAESIIATDDSRIEQAARGFGAPVVLTATTHASGTDRIAEVAQRAGWGQGDIVVNLQGDEPLMPVALLSQVAALLQQYPQAAIATLCTPIPSREALLDPNVVKVVCDDGGRALYFSRAPIPWCRDAAPEGLMSQREFGLARRHIGLYAYRVGALQRLATLPPGQLEDCEKLEQLRALQAGMEIRVAAAVELPGPDVNAPADLARVAQQLGGVG